jgi:hypothetical protein
VQHDFPIIDESRKKPFALALSRLGNCDNHVVDDGSWRASKDRASPGGGPDLTTDD